MTETSQPAPGARLDRVLGRVRDGLLIVVLLMVAVFMVAEFVGPAVRRFVAKPAPTITCDPRYDCGTVVND